MTTDGDTTGGTTATARRSVPARTALTFAGAASVGAGLVHAAAVGIHAEHVGLTRIFAVLAVLQVAVGGWALMRPGRAAATAVAALGGAALAGWVLTRTTGVSWIGGLQVAEDPQFADTAAATLAAVSAVGGALAAWRPTARSTRRIPVALVAVVVALVTVPAMTRATSHEHEADDGNAHSDGAAHAHGEGEEVVTGEGASAAEIPEHAHPGDTHADDPAPDTGAHEDAHTGDAHTGDMHAHAADTDAVAEPGDVARPWPRPWDPSDPIDFSGVPGVTAEQQARAEQLVTDTLAALPRYADPATAIAEGYTSIGDERTGFEHYINRQLIFDDTWLDPSEPESLVYRVDGDDRTLVSAMYIANGRPIDDPELVDYGGPLMEWHVHDNLCWGLDENGVPKVMAVTDDHGGQCPAGTVLAGGENPMVHVWIAPHACGPFAALEGHGAGQVAGDGTRVDQCEHAHGDDHGDGETPATPYDPSLPIDLGGVDGVTPQQQAFAENLVAATVRDLPRWSDVAVAEAFGFRSIGDGLTGHEHYIQWDWIDDDVWLDPRAPESLVYSPEPDGTKRLVAAMYMLAPSIALADVPDWGGQLMQWHIHDDLCFSDDPGAPQVRGVTEVGGACRPPLVKMDPAPMIHVWIVPHECGPFAALDGIGGGQIEAGVERWCDTAHGSH